MPSTHVERIIRDLGLTDGAWERFDSDSNEVWIGPEHVVRYHGLGPSGRLSHEARVAQKLPPEVRHPTVVAIGWDNEHDWMVLERVDGEPLSVTWPSMNQDDRRRAITELADALSHLHAVDPEGLIPPCLFGGKPLIPRDRVVSETVRLLRSYDGDPGVLDRATEMAKAFGRFVTDSATALIHGDLNFNNVMWADRVTALLDFEWTRPEARDVDLLSVLSFCQHAKRCVPESVEAVTSSEDYRQVPHWLRAAYPDLFADRHVRERVVFYDLSRWAQGLHRSTPEARYFSHDMLSDIVSGRAAADFFEW